MPEHPRCTDCPIAGRCVFEWTGHKTYCDWAKRGGKSLERVKELSAAGPPEQPVQNTSYPSLATKAGNLAHAFWDWAVSGFSMASDEEVARRREICAACPEWLTRSKTCRICGCRTQAKTLMRTEHCPLGKW